MLLSEAELRAALEPMLDRLLIERLRLFQLQLEPRLQGLIEAALAPRRQEGLSRGLERLMAAADANACFEVLFEETLAITGPSRALLVCRRGETAVWKVQGLSLPERFPTGSQASILRAQGDRAGRVHWLQLGLTRIGGYYWEAAREPEPDRLRDLELLLRTTELCLLQRAWLEATPQPAPPTSTSESGPKSSTEAGLEAGIRPAAAVQPDTAEGFARLLVEDLRLYLERERPAELHQARRQGNVDHHFALELERCRRAFRERFPADGNVLEHVLAADWSE